MKYSFQNQAFLKDIYSNAHLISSKGNFLKKHSNRKFSLRDIIIKLLPDISAQNVLDIGCGSCSFINKLKQKYPHNKFFGLDIAEHKSCTVLDYLDYRIYDGQKFPDYDIVFGLVLSMHMLYHVKNFALFFAQVKKILSANGMYLVTTKSKFTFPKIERLFIEVMAEMDRGKDIGKERDEANFCLENGKDILRKFFPEQKFLLDEYVLKTQVIVTDRKDLLTYIFSTQRYNPLNLFKESTKRQKYAELFTAAVTAELFIDEYVEVIYLIKHRSDENRL